MKMVLLPLLLCAAPAFSQEEAASAPVAPEAEVSEAPKGLPRPSMIEDNSKEETKPKPKPESKSEAEPKPEPRLEPKATAAPAAKAIGPDNEYDFAKTAAEDADGAIQEAAIEELGLFARRHPDAEQTPEAIFLRAQLMQKRGDWQPALAAYLRLSHEFPGSKTGLRAKSSFLEVIDKKASRRQRPLLGALVSVSDSPDKGERLSVLWQKLVETIPDAVYEPVADEIASVFVRFPNLKDADKLQAALARLRAANNKPAAALVSWRKLLALHPISAQRANALMAIGDLYADSLRDPKKAIDAYQELVGKYPKAPEVLPALERSARLFDEKLRQYALAVEMHEKVVKLFPKTPSSLKALKSIAKLQRDRLALPEDAIKTLMRLSSMHGGQDGIDALLQASEYARRDLKDYARQAELLRKVSDDYAGASEAPQALYDAAGVYEDSLKDNAKAIEFYKDVANKFPSHKLARRANDRAAKLETN